MRRRTFLGLSALSLLGILTTETSCTVQNFLKFSKKSDFNTNNAFFCVLETRQNIAASRIIFYDVSLTELGELPLPYAGLGQNWNLPVVHDNILFVIPEGYQGKLDEKKVLEIDLSTLEVKTHMIDRIAMYGIAANDNYLYTCNNLNGITYISRCNRATEEVIGVSIEGVHASSIALCEGRICCFADHDSPSEYTSWLYVYNLDLNLVDKINLDTCGRAQFRPHVHNGTLFFPSWSDIDENSPRGSKVLGIYHIDSNTLETATFEREILEVLSWNDSLVMLFGDINDDGKAGRTTSIALCDPENWECNDLADLGYAVQHAAIKNDILCTHGDRVLRTYDLTQNWEIIKKTDVSHIDKQFSYISGMMSTGT